MDNIDGFSVVRKTRPSEILGIWITLFSVWIQMWVIIAQSGEIGLKRYRGRYRHGTSWNVLQVVDIVIECSGDRAEIPERYRGAALCARTLITDKKNHTPFSLKISTISFIRYLFNLFNTFKHLHWNLTVPLWYTLQVL